MVALETIEIAPELGLTFLQNRRVEDSPDRRLVHDAALGDLRLVDAAHLRDGRALRVGQSFLLGARFRVLAPQAFHYDVDRALGVAHEGSITSGTIAV